MKAKLALLGAIVTEVAGTLALRGSADNLWWLLVVVPGYVVSFGLLGVALRYGVPVGVAYGIWGAAGVILVAIFGVVLFGEGLSVQAILGILLIVVGVVFVELGSQPDQKEVTE